MHSENKNLIKNKPLKLCVCVYPFASESVHLQLYKYIQILAPISEKLSLLTGRILSGVVLDKKVQIKDLKISAHPIHSMKPAWLSILFWFVKYLVIQLSMTYNLIKIRNNFDIVIFHYGTHYSMPIIVAKILRKKIVKFFLVPSSKELVYSKFSPIYYMNMILDKICCIVADRLVVGSEATIKRFGINKNRTKIWATNYRWWYIDDIFQIKKLWSSRENTIGYIGRLRKEKGIIELIKAIPLIIAQKMDVRFIIIGDGVLMEYLKEEIVKSGCQDKVKFTGEIPSYQIPDYLNEMKFHVLPSHFELAGAVNLEAMACGTIAVANSVGGVPDLVLDNKTGFLLKNNNPNTIADKIIELWDRPGLEKIIQNAKIFVEDNWSYDRAVQYWKNAFNEI